MHGNPISYTDPDGDFIPAAILGAGIGLLTNGVGNLANGNGFFDGGLKAAAFGAIGGAASFGIGSATSSLSSQASNLASWGFNMSGVRTAIGAGNLAAHATLGGLTSLASGGNFGSGALSGGFGAGSGMAFGGSAAGTLVGGGLSGGVGSAIGGGSFWQGAGQGLISAGLNHGAHNGLFGEGMTMSLLTGKTRHMLGPDAIGFSWDYSIATPKGGIASSTEAMKILRGVDKGKWTLGQDGAVAAGIDVGTGAATTNYYYSGGVNTLSAASFRGIYTKMNLSFTMGIDVGGGISFSPSGGHIMYGLTKSIGVGIASPFGPWNGSLEIGVNINTDVKP